MAKTKDKIEKITSKLNEKQKLFCKFYLGMGHSGTFGNATQSYWHVYIADKGKNCTDTNGNEKIIYPTQIDPVNGGYTSEYFVAKTSGQRMLSNVYIKKYIDFLAKDVDFDYELGSVCKQSDNIPSKVQALTLHARVTNKINQTINIPQLDQVSKDIKNVLETFKK